MGRWSIGRVGQWVVNVEVIGNVEEVRVFTHIILSYLIHTRYQQTASHG